jgi:hypothetical protein
METMRFNREASNVIVAAKVLNELSQFAEFVDTSRMSVSFSRIGYSEPESGYVTKEEWLQLVNRMLDLGLIVRRHIALLEEHYVKQLQERKIDEQELSKRFDDTASMLQLWLSFAEQVIQTSDKSGVEVQANWNELRTEVAAAVKCLKARTDSLSRIDAFIAQNGIPAHWNPEFAERNIESMASGKGIDARAYLASLPH